jgi:hypothetical protein
MLVNTSWLSTSMIRRTSSAKPTIRNHDKARFKPLISFGPDAGRSAQPATISLPASVRSQFK